MKRPRPREGCGPTPRRPRAALAAGGRGASEPGKLADLIVCDRDPLEIPTVDLKDFRPSATILGGQVVAGSLPG